MQTLLQEVKEKRASLDSVSEKLEPIYLVLNTDDHKCLRDLAKQLETNFAGLEAIEEGLQVREGGGRGEGGGGSGRERRGGGGCRGEDRWGRKRWERKKDN